ncbi:hypothetical protein F2Q69_00043431 [Brassica cretica]|uniref:Uncharacterized protein n=1 Tax=Brassica cretica TaxID=69181 RepID=A0A8S9NLH5_BRACR|nr:hypothetical protein F2Q69_00043431 [Brassica cretica]
MGKHFVGEDITSGSSGGHYSGYVCTLEVEEMTGGDSGGREDDGGDETISSSDASDSRMAMSGDGAEEKHNGANESNEREELEGERDIICQRERGES